MSRLDELLKEKARRESQTEISPEPSPTPAPTPTQTTTTSRLDGLLAEKQRRQQPTSSRLDQLLMEKQRRDSSLPVIQEQHKVISNLDRGTIKSLLHTGDQYQTALKKQYPNLDVSQRNGQVIVKQAGDKEWRVLDPSGWQGLGELGKDVTDWSYDIATAVPRLGSWAGGILGGAAAEGLTEAGRQGLAKGLGLKDDISAGTIGAATAFGAAGPLVGKGISKGFDAARRGLFNRGKAVVSRFDIDNASLKLAGQRMSKNVPGLKDVDEATREALGGWVQQNKLVDATSISDKALLPNLQKKSKLVDQEYKEFWNQVNAQNPGPLMKEFSAKIDNILQDPKMAPQYKELTKSLKTSYAEITGSSKALNSIYNLSPDMKVNLIGRSIRDILKSKSIKGKPKADLLDILSDGIMELDMNLNAKVSPELWNAFDSLYTDRVMIDLLYDSTNKKLREHGGSAVKQFLSQIGKNLVQRGAGALLLGGGIGGVTGDWKTAGYIGGGILLAPYASSLAKNLVIKYGFKTPTVKFGTKVKDQLLKFPGLRLTGTPSAGLSVKLVDGKKPLTKLQEVAQKRSLPKYDTKVNKTDFTVDDTLKSGVDYGNEFRQNLEDKQVRNYLADLGVENPTQQQIDLVDDHIQNQITRGTIENTGNIIKDPPIQITPKPKEAISTDIDKVIYGPKPPPDYTTVAPQSAVTRHPETGRLVLKPKANPIRTSGERVEPSPYLIGKDRQIRRRSASQQELATQKTNESFEIAKKSFVDPKITKVGIKVGLAHRTNKPILYKFNDMVNDPLDAINVSEEYFKKFLANPKMSKRKKQYFKDLRFFSGEMTNKYKQLIAQSNDTSGLAKGEAMVRSYKYGIMKLWEQAKRAHGKRSELLTPIENHLKSWEQYIVDYKAGKNPPWPQFDTPKEFKYKGYNPGVAEQEAFIESGTKHIKKVISDGDEPDIHGALKGEDYISFPRDRLGINTDFGGLNEKFMRQTTGKPLGRPPKPKPKKELTQKTIEDLKRWFHKREQ